MQSRIKLPRSTSRRVRITEAIAEIAIRAGGVGTIAAVALMMAFLFSVAWPLFKSPVVLDESASGVKLEPTPVSYMGVDEGGSLVWLLEQEGRVRCIQLSDGHTFFEQDLFPEGEVTSVTTPLVGETFSFGFADGTIRKAKIGYHTEEILERDYPAGQAPLANGGSVLFGREFFERTPTGSLRRTTFGWTLQEPFSTPSNGAIVALDRVEATTGEFFGLVDKSGAVHLLRVRETENLMTGEIEYELEESKLAALLPKRDFAPNHVYLGSGATQAFVTYADGQLIQFSLLRFSQPELVETVSVVDSGRAFDRIGFLPGRSTLLVADSEGGLASWFTVRPKEGGLGKLTRIQSYGDAKVPLSALAFSHRSRLFLAGRADGKITAWQGTLGTEVQNFEVPAEESIRGLAFHPRQDGLVALTDKGLHHWRVNFGYPEASLKAIFLPIRYEGSQAPEHSWQSSASSDDYEPKMGMWPLVFGTIKATLFAMLFGAPIAVLGALFTSEYMHARSRATTKTLVELLAGLPSVVLGFLAALVVAPFVQNHLSATLAFFFLVPLLLLLGAFLWQLQPTIQRRKRSGWIRQLAILVCPIVAGFLATGVGPLIESLMFGGDSAAWLDGRNGGAASGWFFLLLPFSGAFVLVLFTLRRSLDASPVHSLVRFLLGTLLTIAVALGVAFLLQTLGFDPRGGIVDTYEQRNALIVGIAVGLVVLPIVYTLTEDALGEVPQNLREASLGAGATQWQTAVRVVLPFATSGIFSALMVGLGRAVGETMIVLMAAGSTALTEWNVFNGFRTLAANIATEIPEAVVGSAHYRALFFTAILLFGMTFVINTLAELVRRHFRAKVRAL